MTTIAFGGGPTVDQRRSFAGLKDGAHVPGYRGYVPQLKYRVGKSYGNDTYDLSTETNYRTEMPSVLPQSAVGLVNQLPESTGDNKYSKNMVPGYTGYIPRMPFKYGDTYKVDCDSCLDDHITNMKKQRGKEADLKQSLRAYPKLNPVKFNPEVKDHMNTYRDTHPERPLLMEDKRSLTEPPMPGYYGYVPRIHTTELGLGCRYHQMTKNGLEAFAKETEFNKALLKQPISINRNPTVNAVSAPSYARRLYLQDGMIPKYTGYVPQRRFNFGNTYGDTTRSLEVCEHDRTNFGEYMSTKPLGITKSIA